MALYRAIRLCDSDTDSNHSRCERAARYQKHKPCETRPFFCRRVSEYGWKSDWENRWDLIRSHSGNQSGEPTVLGDSLRRLRVRLEERLGKPMGLDSEPFLKPIGRANSTRGHPYFLPTSPWWQSLIWSWKQFQPCDHSMSSIWVHSLQMLLFTTSLFLQNWGFCEFRSNCSLLEIKGRFRVKGWFWRTYPRSGFRSGGTSGRNHPFGNHPFANTKKAHWEIKGRFPKGWFWRMYPRSGFRSGEHPPKPPFWKPPFCEPPNCNANSFGRPLKAVTVIRIVIWKW